MRKDDNTGESIPGPEDRICSVCGFPKSAFAKTCRDCVEGSSNVNKGFDNEKENKQNQKEPEN